MQRYVLFGLCAFGMLASPEAHAQAMPRYDVEAYCQDVAGAGGGSSMIYNGCIDMEQAAYDKRKSGWAQLSARIRSYCNEVARAGGGGSYSILDGCIDMESDAASAPSRFRY